MASGSHLAYAPEAIDIQLLIDASYKGLTMSAQDETLMTGQSRYS